MTINSDKKRKNSLLYQLETFRYAFNGLRWFFSFETKSAIHMICALVAILAGFLLKITLAEWTMIAIAIGLVFISEIINTGMELIVDKLEKEPNETAGRIKDLAAGAVFIAAVTALTIGIIVFVPKLLLYL